MAKNTAFHLTKIEKNVENTIEKDTKRQRNDKIRDYCSVVSSFSKKLSSKTNNKSVRYFSGSSNTRI